MAHKPDMITAIGRSAEALHQQIEMHRRLVDSVLGARASTGQAETIPDGFNAPSQEERLKQAIMETIDVLEESRKAFKSKRLEALRKKLTVVLIDHR
jgi:hypothetical protein